VALALGETSLIGYKLRPRRGLRTAQKQLGCQRPIQQT